MTNNKSTISNKDVVLRTAMHLFLTKGFQATSMDEIVATSKVSKTNIYYHFKSKEELLLAIVDQLVSRYESRIVHVFAQNELALLDKLERLFDILGGDQEQSDILGGCPFLTLYSQTSNEYTLVRERIKVFFDHQIQAVEELLGEAIQREQLRNDLPVRQTAALIVTSLEGALFIAKASDKPMLLKDLFHALASMLK